MKKKCDHYWFYENAVWQAGAYDNNVVAVGRFCYKCKTMQTAKASVWKPLPKSYVDMRNTLRKAAQ